MKRWTPIMALFVVVALILTACPAPTPQIIEVEKEVVVEKKVIETVEVVKEVPVEKIVKETVEVEVERVVIATAEPPPEMPTAITLIDTNSGANFQWYWQTQVIPAIAEQLGITVDYVVSSEAEVLERMKAWEAGQGDAHLLFTKPGTIPKAMGEGIELETLYPDKVDVIPNIEKCPKSYLETVLGEDIDGRGALYWRSQYALI